MSEHTCKPDHAGVLADDCPRCDEHASHPMLLGLDQEKTERLWNRMLASSYRAGGSSEESYETENEAKAGERLYLLGVWLERFLGIDPWHPFAELRQTLHLEDVYVVFDGPPGPEPGRFVEVETFDSQSRSVGGWEQFSGLMGAEFWRLGPFKVPAR